MIEMQEKAEKEEEKRKKEIEKKAALAMESFPELVTSVPKIVENTCNFLEKVQTKSNLVKQVHSVLQKGWTELGRDTKSLPKPKPISISRIKECNQDLSYEVFDHLVYLHEKRTNEYIESWGQDEWENMFLFPSYDYYYFDKLDEIYAKNNPEYQEEFSDYDCEYE
jgi:ribulose bisphosphate carboxylase small subunit